MNLNSISTQRKKKAKLKGACWTVRWCISLHISVYVRRVGCMHRPAWSDLERDLLPAVSTYVPFKWNSKCMRGFSIVFHLVSVCVTSIYVYGLVVGCMNRFQHACVPAGGRCAHIWPRWSPAGRAPPPYCICMRARRPTCTTPPPYIYDMAA